MAVDDSHAVSRPRLGYSDEEDFCYCGKGRNLGSVELQCTACGRWYHADCTSCYLGTVVPFMCNYIYQCKHCNSNGSESFQRKQASFQQICYTSLANLTHQAKCRGESRVMFSKDREIIPFIEKQWENLTTMPRRIKLTWHTTVHKTLQKETDIFFGNETPSGDLQFGLLNPDLTKVTPAFEILTKSNTQVLPTTKPGVPVDKGLRGQKRKAAVDSVQPVKLKRGELVNATKLAVHGYPTEHPFNKDGYRYVLAEPDPHAPNRQAYDESVEWAGKPIPGYLYRTFLGSEVLLALHDRAPQLKISDDRLSVTGEKGYSMIRASHGVRRASWYFEVTIDEMPENTATRLGWSQMLGNLQAPCGYDKFSYSWRSRKGTKFHQSRGKVYSEPYGEGDTLGFHIFLPEPDDLQYLLPQTCKDKHLVKFKNNLYYEEKDSTSEAEKALKPAPGSKITFYKNGKCQGVAFEDLFEGLYYPAISLYKSTKVTVNFGPKFKFPPDKIPGFRPMSDSASEAMVEYALADTVYHVENEGKLPEFQSITQDADNLTVQNLQNKCCAMQNKYRNGMSTQLRL